MCCFTGPVDLVTNTKIFARVDRSEQFLVYEMKFSAAEELAMVLPIPVVVGCAEDAVRFISFEDYPYFFTHLNLLFRPPALEGELGEELAVPVAAAAQPLEVHSVGAFDASFVPSIADFSRLDERFRLPERVWDDLPGYEDFGFAVFKLKGGTNQEVHPMAFSFPSRDPKSLFFPTVHVHDGSVHPRATFDHVLYCQTQRPLPDWEESMLTREAVDIAKTQGVVLGHRCCYRLKLYGEMDNRDIYARAFEDAA